MPRRAPVQNDLVRELNRQVVLQVLADGAAMSRTRVARESGLSVPTVNTIVNEFVAKAVLREVGAGPSSGGRPAQLVRFDPRARLVLAVDLDGPVVRAACVDLRGDVQRRRTGPPARPGFEGALEAFLRELLTSLPEAGRVGRLAFAVPGVVDPLDGHVRLAPTLGWDDFPLGDLARRACGLPVTLENDVNALTLAELRFGGGRDRRHLVCVAIGAGVGAGLVVDGRLHRGAAAAAGEIGYGLPSGALPGAPVRFGSPGPLERQLLAMVPAFVDADGFVALVTPARRRAFDAFAAQFGAVMHNLACLLNPELLVIAWPADRDGLLAERLAARWCGPLPLAIRPASLGPDAALRGVARLAADELERELCASAVEAERVAAPRATAPGSPAGRGGAPGSAASPGAPLAGAPGPAHVSGIRTTPARAARRSEE